MSPEMIALQTCILARVPVFIWGEPGIGKTSVTDAMARVMHERLWTVILSIREPSDQGGLPVIRPDGSVWMAPPGWAKELATEGHGVVYLDELNVAPPTTQNSALRVVQEGQAGDQKLPVETSFIAAGNPPETNVGAYNLTAAMGNRFVHINWPVDNGAWCEGMISGWSTPPVIKLRPKWREGIAAKQGSVASFIRVRGELLHAKPDDPAEQGRAWASPRMWTTWAKLWAAMEAAGYDTKSEVARVLCAGCVGEATATEFFTWIVNLDLRDPEDYLADPLGTPLPQRQDQLMATLDGLTAAALSAEGHTRRQQIARYRAAWKVLGRVIGDDKTDVAIPAARILAVRMPAEIERDIPPEIKEILPMLNEAQIDFSVAV